MKKTFLCLFLIFAVMLPARAEGGRTFFAMDTVMTISAPSASEKLLDLCEARIMELEALWATTDATSEVARLNRGETVALSKDTEALLGFALDMAAETGGALDITLYPVIRAWGFTTGAYRVPDEAEISRLLEHVGYEAVSFDPAGMRLPEGMMIDLGSVAKGYASDVLAEMLRADGVDSALIDLGGNLYCLGGKPDGSDWRVGIRDPRGSGCIAAISARDCAVVTSGNYERYFDAPDGTRYGHIFDPATGTPVENGLLSVTVIGTSGRLCDALSTALFVMGPERSKEYLASHGEVSAILLRDDGSWIVSAALRDDFAPMGVYKGAGIEWIDRGEMK